MSSKAVTDAVAQLGTLYVQVPEEICQAHTVYEGQKPDGTPCAVVVVPKKLPTNALNARESIPKTFTVWNDSKPVEVPTDVVEGAPFKAICPVLVETPFFQQTGQVQLANRECHSPLKFGGDQIQPAGANWVGTLGGMVVKDKNVYAITNAHVTGLKASKGLTMHQPSQNAKPFAAVEEVHPISFSAQNKIDAALLRCHSQGSHFVDNTQVGLGKLGRQVVLPKLGMEVVKTGRTTGATLGKIVGLNASSVVGYGGGSARYVGQIVIESPSGLFSDAGDSGSFILEKGTNNLVGLLFAGGGNRTIANVAKEVLDYFGVTLYGD